MTAEEKYDKDGIEGWIDESIRQALANLTHPFEKRIALLRKRVEKLHTKIHHMSLRLDHSPIMSDKGQQRSSENKP